MCWNVTDHWALLHPVRTLKEAPKGRMKGKRSLVRGGGKRNKETPVKALYISIDYSLPVS